MLAYRRHSEQRGSPDVGGRRTEGGHGVQPRFRAWLPRPTTNVGLERHVVETWASLAHLEAHGAAPHMAAYAAKTKDLIASRVIHVLSPV